MTAPVVDTSGGWTHYRDRIGKHKSIKTILYKERELHREHNITFVSGAAKKYAELRQFITWKSRQFRRSGWPDLFARPDVVALLCALCEDPGEGPEKAQFYPRVLSVRCEPSRQRSIAACAASICHAATSNTSRPSNPTIAGSPPASSTTPTRGLSDRACSDVGNHFVCVVPSRTSHLGPPIIKKVGETRERLAGRRTSSDANPAGIRVSLPT